MLQEAALLNDASCLTKLYYYIFYKLRKKWE
ncbi:hypothetical protein AAKU61_002568 [Undibacterium sp. GrIS 1.2]